MAWSFVSERAIFKKTLQLKDATEDGFAAQIHVSVAVALLVDCAAINTGIAVQVLNMLLTGHFGEKDAWVKVRNRLTSIKRGLSTFTRKPKVHFSLTSVE